MIRRTLRIQQAGLICDSVGSDDDATQSENASYLPVPATTAGIPTISPEKTSPFAMLRQLLTTRLDHADLQPEEFREASERGGRRRKTLEIREVIFDEEVW